MRDLTVRTVTSSDQVISNRSGTSNCFVTRSDGFNTALIKADGSVQFAGNKCGFTAAGELYFTSRGTRYKLEVAGGLCNAIEYTRELELRERAEELKERIDDKRKPRPTDSVPED